MRLVAVGTVLARRAVPGLFRGLLQRSWSPPAGALRQAFEELGPAFIKLGQFLSVRPDLLPAEALAELEALQDLAAPAPFDALLLVLEQELGASAGRLFRFLDPQPIACASVSQVHRGVLPGGETVAVKVQKPGVAEAIRRDLRLAGRLFSGLVRMTPLRRHLEADRLWAEVLETSAAELDFRREAEAAEAFARSFRGWTGIRIPKVYWGWTSRRVLTAEYIEGTKISDPALRGRQGYPELAELGARAFLKQVLEDGLFHADLHPANLLITPGGEIAYLDFGIVGRLGEDERRAAVGALAGLLSRDPSLALRHLRRLGVVVPDGRAEAFAREIGRVMDEALRPRLGDIALGRIGRGILSAVYRNRVVFPRKYALLIKALLTIEGTARILHPEFSFETAARQYLRESVRRGFDLTGLLEAVWRGAALLGLAAVVAAEYPEERSIP